MIDYLPYPGNYGFIPRTLSAKEDGGDGDPLDVLVLGAAQPKGSIIRVHLIGVLKLLDEGEQDDKLIAVPVATEKVIETPLTAVRTLAHLNAKYPGIDTIVETWFANYDGAQTTKVVGWDNETEAERLFEQAERAYASQR